MVMKKKGNRRKAKLAEFKSEVLQNNLMQRFIREIEREEWIDDKYLRSMLVYQRTVR